MHELGVTFHILDHVEGVAAANNVTRVSKVVLELGEVSTVIGSYLHNCWKWAASKRPLFEDCELEVEKLPAITFCENCGKTYGTVEYGKICPYCGSEKTCLLQGNEFNIKEIEVESGGKVMFFDIYGETAGWQLLGWLMVFVGLVVMNEIARRSKAGGIACFVVLPAALTVYFIAIYIGAAKGAEWALDNDTYVHMNSWFHYAKLYAATAGGVGFMILKYHWGKLGKSHAFKVFPFVIVAINILIAVASDFESAIRAGSLAGGWWLSSEGVWLYGGWWNVLNGIAGLFNIFCMTGWWGIYSSKNRQDMLWPDMIWVFILAYDIWNFEYTYLNLPTHSWYCGLALLLAPTFAAALWNKGGWIQNRANTLALWCMFAQVFPLFQDASRFTTVTSVYGEGGIAAAMGESMPVAADPLAQGLIAVLSIAVNVFAFAYILRRAKSQNKNPWKNEIFTDTRDYIEAMERA